MSARLRSEAYYHVLFSLGIYLLDMIYIDSAYPASDSIIETEQRTNQMNNLLRVISDLQMSCKYGKKQVYIYISKLSGIHIVALGIRFEPARPQ